MDADLKKLKKLVAFMRKQGVLTLKMEGIELNLDRGSILPEPTTSSDDTPTLDDTPKFTSEDILFWSSPGLQLPDEANQ